MKIKYLLLFLVFFLTGCYNYNELDDLAIANGIAIDKKNDEYLVSILIANSHKTTGISSNNQASTSLFQGKGKTIDEAITDLELTMPKLLYLGHVTAIVLGEDYTKEGIYNFFEYTLRNPELFKKMFIMVSDDVEAYKLLATLSPLETFPSENLITNIETTDIRSGNSYNVSFSEIVYRYVEEGYDFLIPNITIDGDEKKAITEDNIKDPIADAHLKVKSFAIFKNDKLVDEATVDEAKGINIMNDLHDNLKVSYTKDDKYVSATLNNIKCKKKFKLINNKPYFFIDVSFSYDLNVISSNIDITDQNTIDEINNNLNKEVKSYINKAIDLSIYNKSDIFGFGNIIYKKNPDYFKLNEKNNYLDLLHFKINVQSNMKSIGAITTAVKEKKK